MSDAIGFLKRIFRSLRAGVLQSLPVMRKFEAWAPIIAALIVTIGGWFAYSRTAADARAQTDYQRREQRYANLVSSTRGFHSGGSPEDKTRFLNELDLCWLYCDDAAIRDAYRFLKSVETGATSVQAESDLGTLMLDIRRDLLRRKAVTSTELRSEEFRILKVK
jgi:hypothetical protein